MGKAIDVHQGRAEWDQTIGRRVKVIDQMRRFRPAALNFVLRSIDIENLSAGIGNREDPYIAKWFAARRVLKKLNFPVFVANLKTLHSAGFRLLAKSSFRRHDQFALLRAIQLVG